MKAKSVTTDAQELLSFSDKSNTDIGLSNRKRRMVLLSSFTAGAVDDTNKPGSWLVGR
ncbi:MAG: hypothetical protein JSU05_00295 [Bacteroidetes bacterium]|nr:hypothetical protein [Bacteroidota bacterium]